MTISGAVLNQKGTPAMWSDPLADRPPFGYPGRLFVNTTVPYGMYRDTGSAWVLITGTGSGTAQIISISFSSALVIGGQIDLTPYGPPAGVAVYDVYLDGIQVGSIPNYNSVTKILSALDDPMLAGTVEVLMTYE